MENDEFIPSGVGKFLAVLVIMVIASAIGITIKRENDALERERQASEERMYLACINRLTNPESPQYATQLKSCKKGS